MAGDGDGGDGGFSSCASMAGRAEGETAALTPPVGANTHCEPSSAASARLNST
jgi:hypothetical protein